MGWKHYCKPENWHPYAKLFPSMSGEELDSLAQDIRQNGLQEPVRIYEHKVLDGRNRLLACMKAGVEPKFIHWHQNGVSPLAFVIAQNLERRHLTTSQRAAFAALLLPRLRKEAQERQRAAGKHGINGGRGHKREKPSAQKRAAGFGKSSELAAARFGVSPRTIEKAASLEKKRKGVLRDIAKGKVTLQQADKDTNSRGKLHERFVAPPFTVLDARQGYWQTRKQFWRGLGVAGGHNEQLNSNQFKADGFEDNSAFDPVLAECVYRWFAPSGGRVLDPFAGEAIKGLVAAKLGYKYTGIERRVLQVNNNRKQATMMGVSPRWIVADSTQLSAHLSAKADFDLIFTSPPYYNLEKYTSADTDASAVETYEQFLTAYESIFTQAVARLKENRFVVIKIGDVRDEKGFYRNLAGDSVSIFLRLGLKLYNMAILVTPIGNLPIRSSAPFEKYRKLSNAHQYVQCFFKGEDAKAIPQELGALEISDLPLRHNTPLKAKAAAAK
jgi:DNA modification methylase